TPKTPYRSSSSQFSRCSRYLFDTQRGGNATGGLVYIVLMIGSPGTGKTMLARRLPTILPPLSPPESLETTRIYSAMGRLKPDEPLLAIRPFRTPHHTISDAGMVGGGSTPAPGELSLAHHG